MKHFWKKITIFFITYLHLPKIEIEVSWPQDEGSFWKNNLFYSKTRKKYYIKNCEYFER